jgi:hypothetical protein
MRPRYVCLLAGVLVASPIAADQPADANAEMIKDNPDQARAVAAIKRLGGTVWFDDEKWDRPVVRVDLHESTATDGDLSCLRTLTGLKELDLSGAGITDAGLDEVKVLPALERLYIDEPVDEEVLWTRPTGLQGPGLVPCAGGRITAPGERALQQALPRTRIIHVTPW